jgi:hypothetical protein
MQAARRVSFFATAERPQEERTSGENSLDKESRIRGGGCRAA